MTFVLKCAGIFALVATLNFLWGQYVKHVANADALRSASYATLIYLLSCAVTVAYVNDHAMIVPAAMGSFVGTYTSALFNKRRK